MEITGHIKQIIYTPTLCNPLVSYPISQIKTLLSTKGAFKVNFNGDDFAVSRWVSAKRTRSYPYARVYDTLGFTGKRITVIPIYKDEGLDGDRDFLQFDTVSLMSLLGVYVILAYYIKADRSSNYTNKITNQEFDHDYVMGGVKEIVSYHSDALHWNMNQLEKAAQIGQIAIESYKRISDNLGVSMHSEDAVRKKIRELSYGIDNFKEFSRERGIMAQHRESKTIQPKELLDGEKATITITNFYKGLYPFTVDEAFVNGKDLYLTEAKHTNQAKLPSMEDVKDGVLKMIIFSNLSSVYIDGNEFNPIPILKLTTASQTTYNDLDSRSRVTIERIRQEARTNKFRVIFNGDFI